MTVDDLLDVSATDAGGDAGGASSEVTIDAVRTQVLRFPTPDFEADGTLGWRHTDVVTVELDAGGETGLGWSYTGAGAAAIVRDELTHVVSGQRPAEPVRLWEAMVRACRNLGTRGVVMAAISAVDIAVWDLKARLLGLPLSELWGQRRDAVQAYGSGGFTSQDDRQLIDQVHGWLDAGCSAVKIKIGEGWGTRIDRDLHRIRTVTDHLQGDAELFVDANGAYHTGPAKRVGRRLDELGVTWFEEPVTSDDVAGLALLRTALATDIAAGEYVNTVDDACRLVDAVDCLQLDVTRCGGYTGWRRCAEVARSHHVAVSGHCAPSLHAALAQADSNVRHVEWFADHARIEPQLVDGAPVVVDGMLRSAPGSGHGMRLKPQHDAVRLG